MKSCFDEKPLHHFINVCNNFLRGYEKDIAYKNRVSKFMPKKLYKIDSVFDRVFYGCNQPLGVVSWGVLFTTFNITTHSITTHLIMTHSITTHSITTHSIITLRITTNKMRHSA